VEWNDVNKSKSNAFLYGKTKEKVYITAGPEFGVDLHGKNLIIDKSLYGLKISTAAARFHDHLSESLLRLGELYGLSYCACDIGNAFLYGKTKRKSI
jgi:hypothetical protein